MVAARRHLPGVPAVVRRFERRRHRGPARGDRAVALSRRPRRGRGVVLAVLREPAARHRLRRVRLPFGGARVRHGRRRAAPHRPLPRAGHEGRVRPGPQPHLGRAPVVRRVPFLAGQPEGRLVRLGRRRHRPARSPEAAEQLALGAPPAAARGSGARSVSSGTWPRSSASNRTSTGTTPRSKPSRPT